MPNPTNKIKEEILKDFNEFIDILPSRVGETPKRVIGLFLSRKLDQYAIAVAEKMGKEIVPRVDDNESGDDIVDEINENIRKFIGDIKEAKNESPDM